MPNCSQKQYLGALTVKRQPQPAIQSMTQVSFILEFQNRKWHLNFAVESNIFYPLLTDVPSWLHQVNVPNKQPRLAAK